MSEDKKQGELYKKIVQQINNPKEVGRRPIEGTSFTAPIWEYDISIVLDEAKADIALHTIPSSVFLNLGGYVLVEKSVLLKWFGEK